MVIFTTMKEDTLELAPVRGNHPLPTFQVGDHPALDFLNTIANLNGHVVDWLESGDDLLAWMVAVKAIDDAAVARFSGPAHRESLKTALSDIVAFREWFRRLLSEAKAQGEVRLTPAQRQRLNSALSKVPSILWVDESDNGSILTSKRVFEKPGDLIGVIAGWVAELLCESDLSLVRRCESQDCVLWFYDRSKNHRRRWCSSDTCGNREKVAAHRARKRQKKE
jgi:predicted RNA-binding Zn ribbon-like protein